MKEPRPRGFPFYREPADSTAAMDYPPTTPPLPAEYYRRHAERIRQLASEATTAAVKEHLRAVALQYELLAERVDHSAQPTDP
jgi:hypothetical protein